MLNVMMTEIVACLKFVKIFRSLRTIYISHEIKLRLSLRIPQMLTIKLINKNYMKSAQKEFSNVNLISSTIFSENMKRKMNEKTSIKRDNHASNILKMGKDEL